MEKRLALAKREEVSEGRAGHLGLAGANCYVQDGGFPVGSLVKSPPANAGDMGLIPSPGRSHMPQSN